MKYIISFIGILLISSSCKKVDKKPIVSSLEVNTLYVASDTVHKAMGAYFSSKVGDEIILSWSEEIDTLRTNILKYKVLDLKSGLFGKTNTVFPSKGMQAHHESMAKVAKTANGVMYAVYRFKKPTPKSRFAGAVYYSISVDNGTTWSKKQPLVTDKTSQSQSFYDLELLPNGELGMCWLDSRKMEKEKDGSSLFFAITNNTKGFVNEKPIAGSTCQCCRTDIFVSNKNTINVAFRNIMNDSIRDMFITKSLDNGKNFTTPVLMGKDNWKIFGCPHTGPSLANTTNDLAVAWYTGAKSGKGIFFKLLTEEASFFQEKIPITATGLHPQMIGANNGNYYLVYEENYKEKEENYNDLVLVTISETEKIKKEKISNKLTKNDHAVLANINKQQMAIAWVNNHKIVYKIINK